jgi:uncharacterized membrane protein
MFVPLLIYSPGSATQPQCLYCIVLYCISTFQPSNILYINNSAIVTRLNTNFFKGQHLHVSTS